MLTYLLLFVYAFQVDVPYKPDDEFLVSFELVFKKRGEANHDDLVLSQVASSTYDRPDNSPLPYLRATLEILKKTPDEAKLKIIRDGNTVVAKHKVEPGSKISVFSGFVDDIQDQVSGYQHTIYFLDKKKITLSKIVIEFDSDGFYLVNGKKKGKL